MIYTPTQTFCSEFSETLRIAIFLISLGKLLAARGTTYWTLAQPGWSYLFEPVLKHGLNPKV